MIGYTASHKTLKEPKPLKIGTSVISGRRPFLDTDQSQYKFLEEKIKMQNHSNMANKNEDARCYRNADTSDTFNRNTDVPQSEYAYSKLSKIYLGLKPAHGASPFQNQSQKYPKSRKIDYKPHGPSARRTSPKAQPGNGSYKLTEKQSPGMVYISQ